MSYIPTSGAAWSPSMNSAPLAPLPEEKQSLKIVPGWEADSAQFRENQRKGGLPPTYEQLLEQERRRAEAQVKAEMRAEMNEVKAKAKAEENEKAKAKAEEQRLSFAKELQFRMELKKGNIPTDLESLTLKELQILNEHITGATPHVNVTVCQTKWSVAKKQ